MPPPPLVADARPAPATTLGTATSSATPTRFAALRDDVSDEDQRCLARFCISRCQESFALLVERHISMVRQTCQELLGPQHPWLDDACQAVFLVLARRASEIRNPAALAAWLRTTARGVAANVRRSEQRRQRRERSVGHQAPITAPEPVGTGDESSMQLEAAISLLSEAQRRAVIGHFLEGKRQAEVASELGVSEGAIKKRIADAMVILRGAFARGGVSLPSMLAAATLRPDHAVSPDLLGRCLATGSGRSGPLADALSQGVARPPRSWFTALVGAAVLAGGLLALGLWAAPISVPSAPALRPAVSVARDHVVPPSAAAGTPEEAILAPIRAIRHNDVRALLAALPEVQRRAAIERWERFAATPMPASDRLADWGLAKARTPEAFATFLPLYHPLTTDLHNALVGAVAKAGQHGDHEMARLLGSISEDLDGYVATLDLRDPQLIQASVARSLATAYVWPFTRVAEFRRMPVDQVVDTLGQVLASIKRWWAPYGLDVDGMLDSVQVLEIDGSGPLRHALVSITMFGHRHLTRVAVQRIGEPTSGASASWMCPEIGSLLDTSFIDLSHYFFLPTPTIRPSPQPAVSSPAEVIRPLAPRIELPVPNPRGNG